MMKMKLYGVVTLEMNSEGKPICPTVHVISQDYSRVEAVFNEIVTKNPMTVGHAFSWTLFCGVELIGRTDGWKREHTEFVSEDESETIIRRALCAACRKNWPGWFNPASNHDSN